MEGYAIATAWYQTVEKSLSCFPSHPSHSSIPSPLTAEVLKIVIRGLMAAMSAMKASIRKFV